MTRKRPISGRFGTSLALSGATCLLLAGCASVPPPTSLMSQATADVDAARAAGARDHAPLELGFALKKLDLAQSAMGQEDYEQATRLAQESQANSNLARVKSQLARLRDKIDKQGAENARMRSKLDDNEQGAGKASGGGA